MSNDELIQKQIAEGSYPQGMEGDAYRMVFRALKKEPSIKLPDDFAERVAFRVLASKKSFDWDKFFLFGGLWFGSLGLSFASGCGSNMQTGGRRTPKRTTHRRPCPLGSGRRPQDGAIGSRYCSCPGDDGTDSEVNAVHCGPLGLRRSKDQNDAPAHRAGHAVAAVGVGRADLPVRGAAATRGASGTRGAAAARSASTSGGAAARR